MVDLALVPLRKLIPLSKTNFAAAAATGGVILLQIHSSMVSLRKEGLAVAFGSCALTIVRRGIGCTVCAAALGGLSL